MSDPFAVLEREDEEQIIFLEGYEDCLIGTGETFTADGIKIVAIYDVDKILRQLGGEFEIAHDADGCDCEEHDYLAMAEEFYAYNIIGSYIGAGMPVFLTAAKGAEHV